MKFGAPHAAVCTVAFASFDPDEALKCGQAVASERIVRAVPGFVASAVQILDALPAERRAKVRGVSTGLFAVLVHETVSLRRLSDTYDKAQSADAMTRARTIALADEAGRDARREYVQARWLASQYLPATAWREYGLDAMPERADSERPAASVDALAKALGAWLATVPEETRGAYAELGLGSALVTSLQTTAATLRATRAEMASSTASTVMLLQGARLVPSQLSPCCRPLA